MGGRASAACSCAPSVWPTELAAGGGAVGSACWSARSAASSVSACSGSVRRMPGIGKAVVDGGCPLHDQDRRGRVAKLRLGGERRRLPAPGALRGGGFGPAAAPWRSSWRLGLRSLASVRAWRLLYIVARCVHFRGSEDGRRPRRPEGSPVGASADGRMAGSQGSGAMPTSWRRRSCQPTSAGGARQAMRSLEARCPDLRRHNLDPRRCRCRRIRSQGCPTSEPIAARSDRSGADRRRCASACAQDWVR